jgi:RNA polymerase sigma-70 factor (sigma-E family)
MRGVTAGLKGGALMSTRDEQYRAFVEARRGELLRTAVLLTAGDQWAAEDLVQTALTRLYVAWSRVRADSLDAYVRRCLLNSLIDHRRLAATRHEQTRSELPETAVSDLQAIDMRSAVFGALGGLPPRMRAAVVMRHVLDLSVEETAEALGCRRGTVKSQTARGLDRLRAALQAEGVAVDPAPAPSALRRRRPSLGVRSGNDVPSNS